MENKLPQYNTRVKLPTTSDRMAVYDGKLIIMKEANKRLVCVITVNLKHPSISLQVLLTVLYTFPVVLSRRIF